MQQQKKISIFGLALTAAFVALPGQATAQIPAQPQPQPQTQEQCQAQVSPAQLQAGARAAEVRITVSQPIGDVTGVEAGNSGIELASAEDLPRTPLANPDQPQRPIRMGDAPNQWIVYLNTAEARAGEHELTFQSARGTCTARVTVGN